MFYKENKKQENILFEVEKKESTENLFRKLMLLQEFEEDKKDIYESFGVLSLILLYMFEPIKYSQKGGKNHKARILCVFPLELMSLMNIFG